MQVNKRESMYALLVAVAVMIGITIYGSCSADEDYDYYSRQELSTRAEREMRSGNEGHGTEHDFPTIVQIKQSSAVQLKRQEAWDSTLAHANSLTGCEYGFYIYNDKATSTITCSNLVKGPDVSYTDTASVDLTNPEFPDLLCAKFHTHPPLEACTTPCYRQTGPSDLDLALSKRDKIPGLVEDYSGDIIGNGHPKNSSHETDYIYPPHRRPNLQ